MMRIYFFVVAFALSTLATAALPPEIVLKLGTGDGDERIEAVRALAGMQDAAARALIEAVLAGQVQASETAKQVLVVVDGKATDAATGAAIATIPPDAEDLVVNNRLRRALETAIATFALATSDRSAREKAVAALEKDPQSVDEGMLDAAIARESDPELKMRLGLVHAAATLAGDDRAKKLDAIGRLAESRSS